MNPDVRIMKDFIKKLKETYPKIQLDQRDELLINMAINYTLLILEGQEDRNS